MKRQRGFWPETIYAALRALGGEAYSTDIYEWVENNVSLTEREQGMSPHQGRLRYVHTIRATESRLTKRGLLIRVVDGYYRLPGEDYDEG